MKLSKNQITSIGILGIVTVLATTQYFEIGMMGVTGFVLAYLGKGMRTKPRTLNR